MKVANDTLLLPDGRVARVGDKVTIIAKGVETPTGYDDWPSDLTIDAFDHDFKTVVCYSQTWADDDDGHLGLLPIRNRQLHTSPNGHMNFKYDFFLDNRKVMIQTSMTGQQLAGLTYKAGMSVLEYVKNLLTDGRIEKTRKKFLLAYQQCVMPEPVQHAIEEALTVILRKDKFDEWGINEHFEKGITNSILLYGPPGTGKTMIAESIAAVLDKNLMRISTADLQSQIPGQMERNVVAAFKRARYENAVLLLDECDSLLSSRELVGVVMGSEINSLLTELERFDGVCVLTTNRIGRLDSALGRRIIAKIEVPRPTPAARAQIWKNLVPPKVPIESGLDVGKFSTYNMSGGEIKNAILLATRRAIAKNRDYVSEEDFLTGIYTALSFNKEYEQRNVEKQVVHAIEGMADIVSKHKSDDKSNSRDFK